MTYLTQLQIPYEMAAEGVRTSTGGRLQFRDAYDWHQRVWECFPGRDGEPRDFLTRLDERPDGLRLLMISPVEPTKPDWCPSRCWQTKPIPENYFGKDRYAFQLCANPTKKVTKMDPDGSPTKNGKRVPLRQREELVTWMERKGEQGGFRVEVDTLRTIPHGPERFQKDGRGGTHTSVEFTGVLTVADPAKFHETFTHGIGSAKAFGFGLLAAIPLSVETMEMEPNETEAARA